ncbi:hypothetical protein [Segatella copri]|uniref:hypothetical protein n=1 Tax=Segatella copri TaxID=165179 RepID=UPI00222FC41D|nr:hypothetical protein [Segatella copri]MCW4085817.1 hypothetical protein [Segatella copri]MCW4157600.1 hypothetical protein [Segatella copri]
MYLGGGCRFVLCPNGLDFLQDYSAIKDQEFVKQLKEKLKVVYRNEEVKIGLYGRLNVPSLL